MAQNMTRRGRWLVAGIPLAWLSLLFLLPFLIVLKLSFSEMRLAIPPYAPFFEWVRGLPHPALHIGNGRLDVSGAPDDGTSDWPVVPEDAT